MNKTPPCVSATLWPVHLSMASIWILSNGCCECCIVSAVVQVSLWHVASWSSQSTLRNVWLDFVTALFLIYFFFLRISTVAAPVYIPTVRVQRLLFPESLPASTFWMKVTLTGVRWNLSVIWICISLIAQAISFPHIFIVCLRFSLGNYLLNYFSH